MHAINNQRKIQTVTTIAMSILDAVVFVVCVGVGVGVGVSVRDGVCDARPGLGAAELPTTTTSGVGYGVGASEAAGVAVSRGVGYGVGYGVGANVVSGVGGR